MSNPIESTNGHKINLFIYNKVLSDELDNDDLVQIIELAGTLLNLKTIPQYAKDNNLSDRGARSCRKITTLFGNKYIIDND